MSETPDLTTFGETMLRLSPPHGERLETATELSFDIGGAESNVAITASRLDTDVAWLSKLPDSALGRRVTTEIEGHKVDTRISWSDEHRQGTYYLESGGEPRGINVIYDRENAAITTATVADLDVDAVRGSEMFYTSGITPGLSETLEETTAELLTIANDADTTTVFDVNYRSKVWSRAAARESFEDLLPKVDVLVVADRDARTVLGYEGDADEIGTSLYDEFDPELVVVTRGSEGAVGVDADGEHHQPAFEVDTVDPVGTGDAFVGGLLARLLRGDETVDALEYAAATAALKRTISGDLAVITPAEVGAVLEQRTGGISR